MRRRALQSSITSAAGRRTKCPAPASQRRSVGPKCSIRRSTRSRPVPLARSADRQPPAPPGQPIQYAAITECSDSRAINSASNRLIDQESTHAELVSIPTERGSADAGGVTPACVGGFVNQAVPGAVFCGTAMPPSILVTRGLGWSHVCRSQTGAVQHSLLPPPPARTHAVVAHRPDPLRDLAGARYRAG